ncbi:hypothetical protein RFI_04742 [Reticulomyxa filosa]|uniref:Uncharacterized protein n=1 Tax=Reticulomyxa filosa TaxID=46433 RepID=X6P1H3_RETFI|nr:hypothetical protein RFI_04742 [Reticulomyxa filosa]|eukprot:ETO32375.1 hypothetical protein RFI_04742 [Reticulomyxa filosa]
MSNKKHDDIDESSSSEAELRYQTEKTDEEHLTKSSPREQESDRGYATSQPQTQEIFVTVEKEDPEEEVKIGSTAGRDEKDKDTHRSSEHEEDMQRMLAQATGSRKHWCKHLKNPELIRPLVLTIMAWLLLILMLITINALVAAVFVLVYILYIVECCMSPTWKYLRHRSTNTIDLLGFFFLLRYYALFFPGTKKVYVEFF